MKTGRNAPPPEAGRELPRPDEAEPRREGSGEGAGTALARLIEQEKQRERRTGEGEREANEPGTPET